MTTESGHHANFTYTSRDGNIHLNGADLYHTESGGSVTQATSITTGVTLNSRAGQITTVSTTLAAAAEATFTVTNSTVSAEDAVTVCIGSTSSAGTPIAVVSAVADGSFNVRLSNLHASAALDNTLTLNFVVHKAQAS